MWQNCGQKVKEEDDQEGTVVRLDCRWVRNAGFLTELRLFGEDGNPRTEELKRFCFSSR